MSNAFFAFRQFSIHQDRCAMKVSSDACIFGAWIPAPAAPVTRVLDIGAGTGLLSLMLAQRIPSANIVAVEINAAAAIQANENVADSVFRERIELICCDARHHQSENRCDLIVSNPPFFSKSLKGPDPARNAARHDDDLNLETLFDIVARLLADDGSFALLMPFDAASAIDLAAARVGLRPVRQLNILDNATARQKRSCWVFSRFGVSGALHTEQIIVRGNDGYSTDVRHLLDPFYLRL